MCSIVKAEVIFTVLFIPRGHISSGQIEETLNDNYAFAVDVNITSGVFRWLRPSDAYMRQ